jgi:hypothetical protein
MLMSGRCGFLMKDVMRSGGGMRDVTPGKWVLKKDGTELGSFSRFEKCEDGRKSVQVNEPS